MRSVPLLCLLAFLFQLVSSCSGDTPSSAKSTAKPAVVMNDSIWRADSVSMWALWENYWFYDDNDRYDSAIAICQQMIDVGKLMMAFRYDSTIYEKYAKAYGGIGYNLIGKGYLEEGRNFSQKSYDLITGKFGEYHARNTELCTAFQVYCMIKGDYDQALNYCEKSMEIAQHVFKGNHYYLGNILSNYAEVYEVKGDYNNALKYLQKSLESYRSTAPVAMMDVLHKTSRVFYKKHDYSSSLTFAHKSIALANYFSSHESGFIHQIDGRKKDSWHYYDLPAVYILAGASQRELGNTDSALLLVHHGIELAQLQYEKSGNFIAGGYYELGLTFEKMNLTDSAFACFQKVFPIMRQYAGSGGMLSVETSNGIAELHAQLGQMDSAAAYYQKSLHILSRNFNPDSSFQNPPIASLHPSTQLLRTLHRKTVILQKTCDASHNPEYLTAAESASDLAINMVDNMRQAYKWQGSKQELSDQAHAVFEKAIQISFESNRWKNEEKHLSRAFNFAERSKAFILLENLQKEHARMYGNIPPALLKKEDAAAKEIALYEHLILEEQQGRQYPDSSKIRYWHYKLVDFKEKQDALTSILEKEYPNYYRLKYDKQAASLQSVRNKLSSSTALLEYFLGDSTLYLFAITKNRAFCHTRALPSRFYEKIDTLRYLASSNPVESGELEKKQQYRQFVRLSREMYRLLLEPALSKMKASKLVIIPDGPLGYLPFQLLLSRYPDAGKLAASDYRNLPYLFRDYTTRFEFSATVMMQNWGHRKTTTSYAGYAPGYQGDELIAGRSVDDSLHMTRLYATTARNGLSALPCNRPEVELAAAEMGGIIREGPLALESSFKKEAPNSRILHLAMHALTNDEEPLYSQLIFSKEPDSMEDGKLYAYELYNMDLNGDLAVLSACNTGVGKVQRGEGIMSLGRAFKYAGCPNIVTSLWQADDQSTEQIMAGFFRNLKAGLGKDVALCQAQTGFLANAPAEMTHPYFWGTFVLIGNGEPVVESAPWWLLLAGVIFPGGLIFWGWRRRYFSGKSL